MFRSSFIMSRPLPFQMARRSLSEQVRPGRAREIALDLMKKRRAGLETATSSASSSGSSEGSLAGVGLVAGLGVLGAGAYFGSTEEGSRFLEENVMKGTPLGTLRSKIGDSFKPFTDPVAEELLPDFPEEHLPPGMKPPRTLVLDFEDTLCHLEWDRKNGWRAVKRPGVDQFLRRLYMQYEIVLFSSGNQMFLEPFVMSLDPLYMINHRLYRESTVYENGKHIKDLSHLNRDLRRVIVVDDQPDSVEKHPENVIAIKPFVNPLEPDTDLVDLIPFLEYVCEADVPDVRLEIAKYKGRDLAKEFKKDLQKRREEMEKQRKGTLGGAIQRGLLGGGRAPVAPPVENPALAPVPEIQLPGMTPIGKASSLPSTTKPLEPEEPVKTKSSGSLWGSLMK